MKLCDIKAVWLIFPFLISGKFSDSLNMTCISWYKNGGFPMNDCHTMYMQLMRFTTCWQKAFPITLTPWYLMVGQDRSCDTLLYSALGLMFEELIFISSKSKNSRFTSMLSLPRANYKGHSFITCWTCCPSLVSSTVILYFCQCFLWVCHLTDHWLWFFHNLLFYNSKVYKAPLHYEHSF